MAASLCFGLVLATVLVLFLVPVLFSIYGRLFLGARLSTVRPTPPRVSDRKAADKLEEQGVEALTS